MRFAWVIHMYPPRHMAGSEMVAHAVNKFLISKGHQVRVYLMQAEMHKIPVPYQYDGVEVMGCPTHMDGYLWADVLLTHLDYTHHTIGVGQTLKRPVVHFIHNSHHYASVANALPGNSCVYNSHWIREELDYHHPSMVFQPPCDWRHYDLQKDPVQNKYITLINLDENKGGQVLKRVAAALPDKQFLAVKGAYSEPAYIGQAIDQPANVTVMDNTPDPLQIYGQTRILLMLSRYESWGRTATEAMCNGIPVICTPTKGLIENCATAALFIGPRGPIQQDKQTGRVISHDGETYNIKSILKAIKSLDSPKEYAIWSTRSRARSRELDPVQKLAQLEDFMINAVRTYRVTHERKMNII